MSFVLDRFHVWHPFGNSTESHPTLADAARELRAHGYRKTRRNFPIFEPDQRTRVCGVRFAYQHPETRDTFYIDCHDA